MTASIHRHDYLGIAAFTSDNHIVMNCNEPVVEWHFRINKLEQWLTTCEEIMQHEGMVKHRRSIEDLYFSLKAARIKHLQQHEQIVSEAPTAEDLMEYLSAYAASTKEQG